MSDLRVKDIVPKTGLGICGLGCATAVSIVLIILFFPCTVTQLGQHKLGLTRNKITGVVDMDTVYRPGRYWIGFWKEFIEFPSILYTIEFSNEQPEDGVQHLNVLRSRDNGGNEMFLDVSIQYQLFPDRVGQIYREMTVMYENIYISELRDALSKAGNNFGANQVWRNYSMVSEIMTQACIDVLRRYHADCWGLQLWGIRLQYQFEGQLIQTQVRRQAQRTESARLRHAVVRADTEVMLAEYRKNITVIQGFAEANVYRITREATARADANIISAHAESINIVRSLLVANSTRHGEISMNESQLMRYQQLIMLQTQRNASFVYQTGLTAGIDPAPARTEL